MGKDYLKNAKVIFLSTALVALTITLSSCGKTDDSTTKTNSNELVIFHAGSLSVPFRAISEKFQQSHPNIQIKPEAAGSRACARKISDLKKQCDVMASADYRVIDSLLMPDYADFNIKFALNEMVIAYTEDSRYSEVVTKDNWHEILLKDDVAIGRSQPDLDPCGYRTILVFQLAEKYFKQQGLAAKLKSKDRYIRPKETDLLGLLEAGEIDYMFIYRSVAAQHGLKFLELDQSVNLGSEKFDDLYKTVTVTLSGKKPGETITRTGESMVYSVTIPKNAPNRQAAEDWVSFLLSDEGRKIISDNGQPTLTPPLVENYENLPENLKKFFEKP